MLRNKPQDSIVQDIIRNAVKCEIEFVVDSIPVALIGMNQTLMGQYIQFVADRLLCALNIPKIFNGQYIFFVYLFFEQVTNSCSQLTFVLFSDKPV